MRRKDKEITDKAAIDGIIESALVCHLAVCDGGVPYVVPLCFGYDGRRLYLHSAPEGRKIDLIRKNPKVCFGVESTCEVVPSDRACSFTMRYESVVGKGTARIVTDEAEKRRALEVITGRYAHEATPLPEGATGKVTVIAVEIEELTGKRSGY